MPEISIIVPVYNTQEYLKQCLDSIIDQSYKDFELIIIDDGSTDNSSHICDEYALKDKRIRVYHQNNKGLAETRNIGVQYANGKYITFVDSDDYIERDMMEILYADILNTKSDISICGRWHVTESGDISCRHPIVVKKVMTTEEALINLNSYGGFDMSAWGKLYKAEMFNDVIYPKGKNCEDYYTCYLLFSHASKIVYNSTPKYFYRLREGGISRGRNVNLDSLGACEAQRKFFESHYPQLVYIAETACVFSQLSVYNAYIDRKIKCPSQLYDQLHRTVQKYILSVSQNEYIPKMKKMQALVFALSPKLYVLIYKAAKRLRGY